MAKKEMKKGLEGVVVANTAISYIDGLKGKLVYRGYKIEDLADSTFEEVSYLLMYGDLPKKSQLTRFKKELNQSMKIPASLKRLIKELPKGVPSISSLRTVMSAYALHDKDAEDLMDYNKKAIKILAVMPVIIAATHRSRQGKSILAPKKGLSFAGNFLYMLRGKVPTKEEEKVFDLCLILHAEHGFNASTFSSRVTVATLSDIYSGMVSAIGTLKGPLHGGANARAFSFFNHIAHHVNRKNTDSVLKYVDKTVHKMLHEHHRIMGIGHRVYKVKDPRAKLLEGYASKVPKKFQIYYTIAKEIEEVMEEEKHMYPNVDFFSGIVYQSIGIPTSLFVNIFALARTSGWLAHMLEQYADNRLIRPRSTYVGKDKLRYKPISKR